MTERLKRVIHAVCSTPWAIMPEKLDAITELLELKANGGTFTREEIQARIGAQEARALPVAGGIAVLPLHGVIAHRINMMTEISGGTSTEQFDQWLKDALADPNVSAIVIDVDSPGGTIEGVEELASAIYAARGQKPIIAHANSLAASAAYWIAAACDEIVATPSGLVGSIGVFTVHTDVSGADAQEGVKRTLIRAGKYKAEDLPFAPLDDDARAAKQAEVDEVYGVFVRAVAKYRKVSVEGITEGYGEGRALRSRQALAAGMIDRLGTLDDVVASLSGGRRTSGRLRADAAPLGIAASAPSQMLADCQAAEHAAAIVEAAASRSLNTNHTDVSAAHGGEAPAPRVIQILEPAPVAKEHVMPDVTAVQTGADPVESREAALARLAEMHGAQEKLPSWIVKGYTPESAQVQADIKAHYKSRETNIRSGNPIVTGVHNNESDRPFTSMGEQLAAIAAAYSPPGAFNGIGGHTDPRLYAAASGASAGVGNEGGFLIQKDFATDLVKEGFDSGVLASQCSETEIGAQSDGLEVVYIDETSRANGSRWGGVQVYRANEAETVAATKAKLGKWECRLEDILGLAYMTDRLIQDAPAMQSVFEEAFNDEFSFKLDDEIFRGTGAGQCMGVIGADCTVAQSKETGQAADTIVAENIINMWSRVPLRSRLRGRWYYNLEAEVQLQKMMIGTGTSAQLLFMPPNGLSTSPYSSIYARPALPIEHASALGDLGDIAFLDLSQYKLIRKGGVDQAESIHVRFLYNERAFRWTARVNGAPKLKSAITPYKGTKTLSPFVTLAAR